jgi:hypothetical protein
MKLLIAIVVWVGALAGAAELSNTVAAQHKSAGKGAVAAGTGAVSASTTAVSAGTASFDPSSVKAADRLSLFKTANLAEALSSARAHLSRDTQLAGATIYPGYLVLTCVSRGTDRQLVIEANGMYAGSTSVGSSAQAHFPIEQLSAAAPSKLAREIAATAHVAGSRLGYMTLSVNPGSGLKWQIYPLRTGAILYYQASVTGRHLVAWTAVGPRPLG